MRTRSLSVLCVLSLVFALTVGASAQFTLQRGALPALDQDVASQLLLNAWSVQEFVLPALQKSADEG